VSVSQAPRTRSEFRRFVLQHHPDRGGDPAVFAAGMQAWQSFQEQGAEQADNGPQVFFYRKRTVLAQLLHHLRTRVGARRTRPDDRRSRR